MPKLAAPPGGLLPSAHSMRRGVVLALVVTCFFLGSPPLSFRVPSSSAGGLARTDSALFTYFYPRVEFDESWRTSLVVVNAGQIPAGVRLVAYDAAGTVVQEAVGGESLVPGERRVYSRENGDWPTGTASLKVESAGPLLSFVTLETTDGRARETYLPAAEPANTLYFPIVGAGRGSWIKLVVQNAGSRAAEARVLALDKDGKPLASAQLPALPPNASSMAAVADVFDGSVLTSAAMLQVSADEPLAGLQVFGSDNRTDFAALPATLRWGQQLSVPVFQQGDGVGLWTQVGLLNPWDEPVSIQVEAFDAQHRSLGRLTDATSLSGRASHLFETANIGGTLPAEAAFVTVTAEQPVGGYAVIGALDMPGLTALAARTEDDGAFDYELIGSGGGEVLVTVPVVVREDGSVQPAVGDVARGDSGKGLDLIAGPRANSRPAPGAVDRDTSATPKLPTASSEPKTHKPVPAEVEPASSLEPSFGFTDDPLTAQVTPVKAQHIAQLRQAINTLRSRNGLAAFSFTDPTLTPGVTPIRAAHIAELRVALNEVLDSLSRVGPRHLDPTLASQQTVIKKAHIEEIRGLLRVADVFTLTVNKAGLGSGIVVSSPVGIDCGTDCSERYHPGTSVTFTAVPAAGSVFAGWSGGGCTGTGTCTVILNAHTTVTATFNVQTSCSIASIDFGTTRTGTLSSTDCTAPHRTGSFADLYVFSGTAGQQLRITMNSTAFDTYLFLQDPNGTVIAANDDCVGAGLNSCIPINATSGGVLTLPSTGTYTLEATSFTSGATGTYTVSLTLVSSTTFTLTVSRTGAGSGTVTSSPAGINCGTDCTESYLPGTSVTLTATPGTGSVFAGWSGGGCTGTCVVAMNGNATVTATFNGSGLVVNSLSLASAVPGQVLTITGSGFDPAAELSVRFLDAQGFDVKVPAVPAGPTSLTVGVPLFTNFVTGQLGSGAVSVQVVQTVGSTVQTSNSIGLTIQNLPSTSAIPGQLTLAYLDAAIALFQETMTNLDLVENASGGFVSAPTLRETLPLLVTDYSRLKNDIAAVMVGLTPSFSFGTLRGLPLELDRVALSELDRFILALAQAQTPTVSAQTSMVADDAGSVGSIFDIVNREEEAKREQMLHLGHDGVALLGVWDAYAHVVGDEALGRASKRLGWVTFSATVLPPAAISLYHDLTADSAAEGQKRFEEAYDALLIFADRIGPSLLDLLIGFPVFDPLFRVMDHFLGIEKLDRIKKKGIYIGDAVGYLAKVPRSYEDVGRGLPPGGLTPPVCRYSISPTGKPFKATGGNGSVSVTASPGCFWSAAPGPNSGFLKVESPTFSPQGDGNVVYSVQPNTSAIQRTGTLIIAGRTFTVTQEGGCTFSLSASGQTVGSSGGTVSVNVTAPTGCSWVAAVSQGSFITVTSGSIGSGNQTVTLSVAANTSTTQRTGTLIIAGQTFTVTQQGACNFSISPTGQTFSASGGTGSVSVTAATGCTWVAVSNNPSFITVTSGSTGSGPGTVTFSVAANTSTSQRTGTLTIAGRTFTVTQQGATGPTSLTGRWVGTWTRQIGGFGTEFNSLEWNLVQTGSSVTGTFTRRVTGCNGLCPNPVGFVQSGYLINGTISGSSLSIMTDGGTTFSGTVTATTISGTSGGSFPGTFSLTKQ